MKEAGEEKSVKKFPGKQVLQTTGDEWRGSGPELA
jgi:hypothetical protein